MKRRNPYPQRPLLWRGGRCRDRYGWQGMDRNAAALRVQRLFRGYQGRRYWRRTFQDKFGFRR